MNLDFNEMINYDIYQRIIKLESQNNRICHSIIEIYSKNNLDKNTIDKKYKVISYINNNYLNFNSPKLLEFFYSANFLIENKNNEYKISINYIKFHSEINETIIIN